MDQIVLEPEWKILDAWSWNLKFEIRLHSPGSNYCELCPWILSTSFLKAGCKLVSFSCMAFPPVLFMSRRLWYLLRMCSTCLKLAQQHVLWESSVEILYQLNFTQNFWKTLTALDQNIWPSVIIKYGTGFITLVVDEKILDVESHSLMLVNWQSTLPSHFLCNPTFGVISTTERLFSKPITIGGGNDCLEFLV